MLKKIIFIVLIFSTHLLFGQEQYITSKTATGKAKDFFEQGKKAAAIRDVKEAVRLLDKAIDKAPNFIDAYLQKAILFNYIKKTADAELAFEKVLAISTTYEPEVIFSLAETERLQKKESEAVVHYQQYLDAKTKNQNTRLLAKGYIEQLAFIAEAKKNPVPFQPVPLNNAINTVYGREYFPCLTADGETMIFTRDERSNEDFFLSKKVDGVWQKANALLNINTSQNEGAQSISADGRTLVFTACNRPEGVGSCDLYIAEFFDGKWTKPKNMGPSINSKAWDSQPAVSADGKTLYFVSSREGGLGQEDIWITTRAKDGTWSAPKNAGTPTNTVQRDCFPFLHWDDQTLYHCTDGYPGMGKLDIFFSRKNEKNEWDKPVNLGYPINTPNEETSFNISVDGSAVYFAADKAYINLRDEAPEPNTVVNPLDIDIYTFELYEAARPKAVTYVKGKVIEAHTQLPLRAKADIIDLETNTIVTTTVSDGNGVFLICLPAGKNYGLNVNRKNYAFYSDNFELTESKSAKVPFLLTIPLIPLEKSASNPNNTNTSTAISELVVLKNIFFETNSAQLKNTSKAELERLKNLLDEQPTMKIQLNGHTDNVGNDAENMSLSTNRAKAVHDYLIKQNISANRLSFKGFGENSPIASNETPEGRQQNRRTEFLILSF